MYSSVLSLSFDSTVVRFGIKKISCIGEISGGMTICSKSNLCVLERCMTSCLQSDFKYLSGVVCFPFVVFVIFVLIYIQLPLVSILLILNLLVQYLTCCG